MSSVLLDDHLLRDVLADAPAPGLRRLLRSRGPATTNLYYLRLCRSIAVASGGRLTGALAPSERQQLGRALATLPLEVTVVPMRDLAYSMAVLAGRYRLSSLGAEAIAAASLLDAPLCVASSDDGPRIRAAARQEGLTYRVIS